MKLELRTEKLNDIRKRNLVPGVIYGKSIDSMSIQTDNLEILDAVKTYGKNQTFKVRLDGKYHHVYIKDLQRNILKPAEIIHFGLHRVTLKEMMTNQIPVVLHGKEEFFNQALYVDLLLQEISCEYIVGAGISSFDIDVSKLKLGDEIKIKDLKVFEGLNIKNDLEQTIVVIKELRVQAEDETEDETKTIDDKELTI